MIAVFMGDQNRLQLQPILAQTLDYRCRIPGIDHNRM